MFARRLAIVSMLSILSAALLLTGDTRTIAAPGTLDPPGGPIEGTGNTLAEIFDRIDALSSSGALNTDRQVVSLSLDEGTSTQVGDPGTAVLHSVIINTGFIRVTDADGTEFGLLIAQADRQPGGNLVYVSTNQVVFDAQVTLPLTVTDNSGDNSGSQSTLVFSVLGDASR